MAQDVVTLRYQTNRSDLILPVLCCPRNSETILNGEKFLIYLMTEAILQVLAR